MADHSVIDAGAFGDGETDDTEAIQQSFDIAQPGDTVLFPGGKCYRVDGNVGINVGSGVTVRMDGATLQLIPLASAIPVQRIFSTNPDTSNVRFLGGTLIGDMAQCPSGKHRIAIRFDLHEGGEIIGTAFRDWKSDAIWVGGNSPSKNIRIERITVETFSRNAISVVNCEGIEILKCAFTHSVGLVEGTPANPGAGIDVEPNQGEAVHDVSIYDCTADDCEVGIYLQPGKGSPGRNWGVYDCEVHARQIGIVCNSADPALICDNVVHVSQEVGSKLPIGISCGGANEDTRVRRLCVALNCIIGPGRGLVLAGAADSTVFANTFENGATLEYPGLGVSGNFGLLQNTLT